MWTQIIGKTKLALEPLVNHWWNVVLFVTPSGLTTCGMPYRDRTLEVSFDFLAHRLSFKTSDRRAHDIQLYARSVSDFYAEYMTSLRQLGVDIHLYPVPVEFDDLTPFHEDRHHASYDKDYVQRFHRILYQTESVLKTYRTAFIGKSSPIHFFWGSFDLAVSRFSGRRAPERPDADRITREGYSHEVISCGFWPGDRKFKAPAFYVSTAPAPDGLPQESIRPNTARWDSTMGIFILPYDDARQAQSPDSAILEFCQSSYEAGAKLANWDRASLERR